MEQNKAMKEKSLFRSLRNNNGLRCVYIRADICCLFIIIYYLTVIVTALVMNKKVVIFAQGFTPFKTKIGKFFTKFVLKYCDKIYVRDIKSQELLKTMKINSELV
mgnify:CR=1 FL=1